MVPVLSLNYDPNMAIFTDACSVQKTREHKVFCSVLIISYFAFYYTVEVTPASKLPTDVLYPNSVTCHTIWKITYLKNFFLSEVIEEIRYCVPQCAQWYTLTVGGVIMAALHSSCGHYIFILWFLLFFYLFPRLISVVTDWMSICHCQ